MSSTENKLEHLLEFQRILANYHISEDSKQILAQTRMVLLLAPSGGGRNTLIRELAKTGDYHYIISDTTRQPRVNDGVLEQNGVEYWFRSEPEVLADLEAGKFLEAELIHNQQVSGISIRELQKAQQEQRIAITDVDMGGMHNIIQAKPDALALLVLPPSFDEWQHRLRTRGTITPDEHHRRLETACKVFAMALEHPYFKFVINDTIVHATQQVEDIVAKGEDTHQEEARQLAEKLYQDTKQHLTQQDH